MLYQRCKNKISIAGGRGADIDSSSIFDDVIYGWFLKESWWDCWAFGDTSEA